MPGWVGQEMAEEFDSRAEEIDRYIEERERWLEEDTQRVARAMVGKDEVSVSEFYQRLTSTDASGALLPHHRPCRLFSCQSPFGPRRGAPPSQHQGTASYEGSPGQTPGAASGWGTMLWAHAMAAAAHFSACSRSRPVGGCDPYRSAAANGFRSSTSSSVEGSSIRDSLAKSSSCLRLWVKGNSVSLAASTALIAFSTAC